jgi:hypothetical protein
MSHTNIFKVILNLNYIDPNEPIEETQSGWDDFGDIINF